MDGYNDFVNNCELSDWENITISLNSNNPTVMNYDGFLLLHGISSSSYKIFISQDNGVTWIDYQGIDADYAQIQTTIPFNKGDCFYRSSKVSGQQDYVSYYKKRDYSNR